MLVKFRSDAGPSVLMFGEIAHTLLRMMGMSGDLPGAVVAEDVPVALGRLKRALEQAKAMPRPGPVGSTDEPGEPPPVAIATRAFPLVQLLEAAAKQERAVLWDTDRPVL